MGKGLESTFSQRRQITNRYMKRCSTPQFIREIQIKTAMKYHLASISMIITKLKKKIGFWQGCPLFIRMKNSPAIMENSFEVSIKVG